MKTNFLFIIILSVLIVKTLTSLIISAGGESQNNLKTGNSSKQNDKFLAKTVIYRKNLVVSKNSAKEAIRRRVKAIYDSQLGVREATGRNDGPQVEAYLRYTGLGKGHAWCAAFVCWVYGQAEVDNPKTAWAASLFPHDKLVWPRAKVLATGNPPVVGQAPQLITKTTCVFGLYFPSLKRIGHCGFIDEWGDKEVITVEGNTNDNGSREGDGVYRKRRPIKSLYAVADWIGGGWAMKAYLIYVMIGAGFLLSCTTSKLKTKYASREVTSVRSDSAISETSWRSMMRVDATEYNVFWWLKGNARWHPDSGMAADELLIRYRGKDWHNEMLLDSKQRLYERRDILQRVANTKLEEKQKEQKGLLHLRWWAYVVFLLVGCLILFVLKKR